jgi:xanthine dehydrogenase accessory factor
MRGQLDLTGCGDDRDVLAWAVARQPAVLATIIQCQDSGPRGLGAHLAVGQGGSFAGSISGGCFEAEIVSEARDVLADGEARVVEFDTALPCGSRIRVAVAALDPAIPGDATALVLDPATGMMAAVTKDGVVGALALEDLTLARVRALTASAMLESGLFARVYPARPRLVLVGAVHIAQALAGMAVAAGFSVTIHDPRRAFASAARFPGLDICCESVSGLRLDGDTALIALAHAPAIDDPALAQALAAGCFHVGALGSRKTHAARLKRLAAAGVEGGNRIAGPVGLDIGARSPAEIAVAILAELIAVRHGKGGTGP